MIKDKFINQEKFIDNIVLNITQILIDENDIEQINKKINSLLKENGLTNENINFENFLYRKDVYYLLDEIKRKREDFNVCIFLLPEFDKKVEEFVKDNIFLPKQFEQRNFIIKEANK